MRLEQEGTHSDDVKATGALRCVTSGRRRVPSMRSRSSSRPSPLFAVLPAADRLRDLPVAARSCSVKAPSASRPRCSAASAVRAGLPERGRSGRSVGRVLLFGVVQVPVMLGLRAAPRAAARLAARARARSSSDSRSSCRTPCRASSRRSCGATSTRPTSRRSPPSPSEFDFLGRRARALGDRERRHLGLRRLQHAHHLLGAAGDARRDLTRPRASTARARRRSPGRSRSRSSRPRSC